MQELPLIFDSFGDLKDKYVLEIGPGLDIQMRQFLESRGLIYQAIDNWQGSNNFDKEKSDTIYFTGSMDNLEDVADNSLDMIFSCHSFEHSERPVDTLREFLRVLKSEGILLIITPNPCKHHIIDADFDHVNVLSEMQMVKLLLYTGFTGIQCFTQKNYAWKEQDWNVFTIGRKI